MKNNILVTLFFSVLFFYSCKSQVQEENGIGIFDISVNGKDVVFSYISNGESSIYIINIDGSNLRKIISANSILNYYNPRYSPDSRKIVFIANSKDKISSTLCIANSDGSNIVNLIDDTQIITEAIFSLNSQQVYFCKANVYEKYSPIGRKDAHDFDIYSINLKNNRITRITNLNSYGLSNISEIDSIYMLAHLEAGPDGGMYLFSKDKTTEDKLIVPVNNPREDASLYYTPIYSDNLKMMGFTAPYELYVMNLRDKEAKLVFSNKGSNDLSSIVFFKNQPKILFSKVGKSDLFSINIDGTAIKSIPINIK